MYSVIALFGHVIAVVAFLTVGYVAVSAASGPTVIVTAIAVDEVSVIANFLTGDESIAAARWLAIVIAPIAIRYIAIITGLLVRHDAITTPCFRTVMVTTIAALAITVITFFEPTRRLPWSSGIGGNPVTTPGQRTIAIAIVSVTVIAVIAFLAHIDDRVTTCCQRAIEVAAIIVLVIAIIAFFIVGRAGMQYAIATTGRRTPAGASVFFVIVSVITCFYATVDKPIPTAREHAGIRAPIGIGLVRVVTFFEAATNMTVTTGCKLAGR